MNLVKHDIKTYKLIRIFNKPLTIRMKGVMMLFGLMLLSLSMADVEVKAQEVVGEEESEDGVVSNDDADGETNFIQSFISSMVSTCDMFISLFTLVTCPTFDMFLSTFQFLTCSYPCSHLWHGPIPVSPCDMFPSLFTLVTCSYLYS